MAFGVRCCKFEVAFVVHTHQAHHLTCRLYLGTVRCAVHRGAVERVRNKISGRHVSEFRDVAIATDVVTYGRENRFEYAGKPVKRASMMCQAADGGQIIVSPAVWEDLCQRVGAHHTLRSRTKVLVGHSRPPKSCESPATVCTFLRQLSSWDPRGGTLLPGRQERLCGMQMCLIPALS